MKIIISIVLVCLFLSTGFSQGKIWKTDLKKSSLTFNIKNAGLGTSGTFEKYDIILDFDPNNLPISKFNCEIKTESVSTGIGLRDKHLKGKEYFDVLAYPTIKFISNKITHIDKSNSFEVIGELTIKNIKKEIVIPFQITTNTNSSTFEGKTSINRRDFDVGGKSWTMSDIVEIRIKIDASKN